MCAQWTRQLLQRAQYARKSIAYGMEWNDRGDESVPKSTRETKTRMYRQPKTERSDTQEERRKTFYDRNENATIVFIIFSFQCIYLYRLYMPFFSFLHSFFGSFACAESQFPFDSWIYIYSHFIVSIKRIMNISVRDLILFVALLIFLQFCCFYFYCIVSTIRCTDDVDGHMNCFADSRSEEWTAKSKENK